MQVYGVRTCTLVVLHLLDAGKEKKSLIKQLHKQNQELKFPLNLQLSKLSGFPVKNTRFNGAE